MQLKHMLSQAPVAGEFVVEGGLCPFDVANVHDVDGLGTPLYANFCVVHWVVFLWRVELHFVAHVFLMAMLVLVVLGPRKSCCAYV